ncbi:MAG: V-type ATP synthase subunit B [Nitrospirae bacterium]|nr:V-type ATP synthase subunit B [Nitrospirota bacterium]
MNLLTREYQAVSGITGPLLFVERVPRARIGETVTILLPEGEKRRGQVIEVSRQHTVIQVLEATSGIGTRGTRIRFHEQVAMLDVSLEMLGRRFNGIGEPIDGLPPVIPQERREITGRVINPAARDKPSDWIQTGISAIDGLNTLVRGQKLPIFSGSGLPAHAIASQIFRHARVRGEEAVAGRRGGGFVVVFAAMGIPYREAAYFLEELDRSGAFEETVVFLNLAEDPAIERLLTPRCALTTAEFLAFTHGRQALVILTDMTNYCEALREIATAREEIPGRRGYPGYMYTDLASIYERAGRIRGRAGSVTLLPILTMPDDDLTHPIPDLTGYITEGQIVLSRDLHLKGVYPPIDVLPSLSRLMNLGIGAGKTREEHRGLADQLYACYAQGRDLRRLEAIVGEEGLTEADRRLLRFAEAFEREFVGQGDTARSIEETLDLGWRLLARFPRERLTRIPLELVERYYPAEQ